GAKVAVTDINAEPLEKVAAEIEAAGYPVKAWRLDVSDPDEIKTVIDGIAAHFGGIDILVNNAGIGAGGPVDGDEYEETWQRALDVMVTAHIRTIRASLPYLRKSGGGRIVNIASTEALGATKYGSAYTVAKTAVTGLTRSLAVEFGTENITVNCVCPGPIRTGMTDAISEENKQEYARRRVALKRYAEPEEVAHGTLNFVLPSSSFMTGVIMPIDGGLTIKNA
ncbi:MAG: SDR family NAD(P)-dependent oxidoreductase, partial [Gammaproteobacteria bacterium]|nr:SDR family NAD(P)-dependent oxidoreductase [Gammaproteobacteria bacterium]